MVCKTKLWSHTNDLTIEMFYLFSNVKIYKRQVNRKRKNSGSYSNADTVSGSDEENVIPFPRDSYYSGDCQLYCTLPGYWGGIGR